MRDMERHKAKMERKAAERAKRYEKQAKDRPVIRPNLSRRHPDARKEMKDIQLAGCRA